MIKKDRLQEKEYDGVRRQDLIKIIKTQALQIADLKARTVDDYIRQLIEQG